MRARFRSTVTLAALSLQSVLPLAGFGLGFVPVCAIARDYALGDLRIVHPYAWPTPPGARTGGAYFTISNLGTTGDRLLRVASSAAKNVQLHSMKMEGNVMRMRALASLDIPAGATVSLGPGGYHVMLVGLAHPLVVGEDVPLTLTFERSGAIDVSAPVEVRAANAEMAHRH
jgi:copper(I)-binding protein